MKVLSFLFPIALLCSMSMPMMAQDTSAVEVFEALEIGGVISNSDGSMEGVLAQLFEGNNLVHETETKKNGKFKFTLYNNYLYTIQLSHKGYYDKRISVNTKLPAYYNDFSKFGFDIGMTSKEEEKYDPYLSEYPSALISFDKKKKEFIYDKDYTKSYFQEIKTSAE